MFPIYNILGRRGKSVAKEITCSCRGNKIGSKKWSSKGHGGWSFASLSHFSSSICLAFASFILHDPKAHESFLHAPFILYIIDHVQYQKAETLFLCDYFSDVNENPLYPRWEKYCLGKVSVRHLPLLTFAFCGFVSQLWAKLNPSCFTLLSVQLSWHRQQDGIDVTCRMHLFTRVKYVGMFLYKGAEE